MNESESQTRKQRIDQRLRAANPAWLRSYQKNCILAVEGAIMGGRREFLVAMATGTGKTYCTVAQIYRMLQSGLARRILFLVDRKALAAQAVREFNAFNTPVGNKFSQEYEVYSQRFQREDFGDDEAYDPKVLPNPGRPDRGAICQGAVAIGTSSHRRS
jgi:type I site-specific restriction endonuclease